MHEFYFISLPSFLEIPCILFIIFWAVICCLVIDAYRDNCKMDTGAWTKGSSSVLEIPIGEVRTIKNAPQGFIIYDTHLHETLLKTGQGWKLVNSATVLKQKTTTAVLHIDAEIIFK